MTEIIDPKKQEQEAQAYNEFAQYQQNMRLMQEIVREMKEIPVLPSEQPKDINPLTKVELPQEGVLTYMEGFEHPYKGFPFYEFVDKVDFLKKFSRAIISGFYHELKRKNPLLFITLLPSLWVAKSAVRAGVHVAHKQVERFLVKKQRYCTAIRELHRSFSVINPDMRGEEIEFAFKLRDTMCMILEFDNAYRYRFQDILVEMDSERMKTHPVYEVVRLLELMQSREVTQEIKDTWTLFILAAKWYLRFDRKLKKIISHVLSNLDKSKLILDESDKQFADKRKDYTFGFMKQNNVSK